MPATAQPSQDYKKKTGSRGRRRGKNKVTGHNDNNEINEKSTTAIDPLHQNAPDESAIYYSTKRIKPCMENNKLLQGLLRPMPGLLSSDYVFLIDIDWAFDTTALTNALRDLNGEGDTMMDDDEV